VEDTTREKRKRGPVENLNDWTISFVDQIKSNHLLAQK